MAFKEYQGRKQRPRRRRVLPILGALLVIVLIVGVVEFYGSRAATSNTVYCGVFQYLELPVETVSGATTKNVTMTMTTAVSYTTSTNLAGRIGSTTSNGTTTTNTSGRAAGVETICKYISNTSSSSSSTS
ncbi:MAG TPA: hypothetical protein VND41_00500 [Nitrososphaerales archaeon]|nr:hypothetical protein [Nitrososphaerales archaeon]